MHSLVKVYYSNNDVSDINLASFTERDDQQEYNKPSDAMQFMDNTGKKHVY